MYSTGWRSALIRPGCLPVNRKKLLLTTAVCILIAGTLAVCGYGSWKLVNRKTVPMYTVETRLTFNRIPEDELWRNHYLSNMYETTSMHRMLANDFYSLGKTPEIIQNTTDRVNTATGLELSSSLVSQLISLSHSELDAYITVTCHSYTAESAPLILEIYLDEFVKYAEGLDGFDLVQGSLDIAPHEILVTDYRPKFWVYFILIPIFMFAMAAAVPLPSSKKQREANE